MSAELPTLDKLRAEARVVLCRICEDNIMSTHERNNECCNWCYDEVVFGIEQPDFDSYHIDLGERANKEWVNQQAKEKEVNGKRGSKRKKTTASAGSAGVGE